MLAKGVWYGSLNWVQLVAMPNNELFTGFIVLWFVETWDSLPLHRRHPHSYLLKHVAQALVFRKWMGRTSILC